MHVNAASSEWGKTDLLVITGKLKSESKGRMTTIYFMSLENKPGMRTINGM